MTVSTLIIILGGGLVLALAVLVALRVFSTYKKGKNNEVSASNIEGALRDEKLKSSIILSAIEDGVILIDSQKTIQLFNKGASQLTGWPADEALRLDVNSVIKLVDDKNQSYDSETNPLARIFKEGVTLRDNNATLVTRSDKHVAISLSVSPLLDDRKNVTAAVAVFRDVSQERAEEQQRAEFISTASHEMRTPVAAIEGYLALALNDKVSTIDSKARGFLEKAHESTQHLGQLFQDLLTSAKAEDGRLSNHPQVVEMGSFLEKLTNDLRFAAQKKNLAVEFLVGSSGEGVIDASHPGVAKVVKPLYYVYADPDRLREVITNLFDNGVKYTDQGKISLAITGNDDVVQFYVKDTGYGIPTEDISHLFQKFYRVDNSETRTIGGTGLGLFISRKIIELYGGRIWVESKLGQGSTFFINLPRLSSQRAEELQKQAEAMPEPLTSTSVSP